MPLPSDVYINPALQNVVIAYLQDQNMLIAPKVFPIVGVDKQSGTFFKFSFGELNRIIAEKRAPGTESATVNWTTSTDTYSCEEYGLKLPLPDEVVAADQIGVTTDTVQAKLLTNWNLLKLESLFVTKFFTTGLWTGSSTGTDIVPAIKWDASSSIPRHNVKAQIRAIQKKTGFKPNKFIVTPDVDDALRDNADITGMLSNSSIKDPTNADMAKLFGVQEYLVMEGVYNSAARNATDVGAFIGGTQSALLIYAAPVPAVIAPSGGYIFADRLFSGNNMGLKYWTYYEQKIRSMWHEQAFKLDPKLVAPTCGAFFTTVLT